MKYIETVRKIFLLLIALTLAACGTSDTVDDPSVQTGRFIYGPVQGLNYTSEDLSGTTDSYGSYEYYPGKAISFYVGDTLLGTTTGKARITPKDFMKNSEASEDTQKTQTTHICKLLLVLDSDHNPNNGITVDQNAAAMFNTVQDYYPFDLCQSFTWQGLSFKVFMDSPEDDKSCGAEDGEILVHVELTNEPLLFIKEKKDDEDVTEEDTSLLALTQEDFENHPGMANLFLNAFSDMINEDTVTCTYFDDDENHVTDGWYSPFWALPLRYWDYHRKLADKHLATALASPYAGLYTGSFQGGIYSGDLTFLLTVNAFGTCYVQNTYGSTCNGYDTDLASDEVNVDKGSVNFTMPGYNLFFQGTADPDTGKLAGSFYNADDERLGTFTCQK